MDHLLTEIKTKAGDLNQDDFEEFIAELRDFINATSLNYKVVARSKLEEFA